MSAVRAQFQTTCPDCHNLIYKGDNIVFIDDHPHHEECDRSQGPWEEDVDKQTFAPDDVIKLAFLINERKSWGTHLLAMGVQVKALPKDIRMALLVSQKAEIELYELVASVMAEHSDK